MDLPKKRALMSEKTAQKTIRCGVRDELEQRIYILEEYLAYYAEEKERMRQYLQETIAVKDSSYTWRGDKYRKFQDKLELFAQDYSSYKRLQQAYYDDISECLAKARSEKIQAELDIDWLQQGIDMIVNEIDQFLDS